MSNIRKLVPFLSLFLVALIICTISIDFLGNNVFKAEDNEYNFGILSERYELFTNSQGEFLALSSDDGKTLLSKINPENLQQPEVLLSLDYKYMTSYFCNNTLYIVTSFVQVSDGSRRTEIYKYNPNGSSSVISQVLNGVYIAYPNNDFAADRDGNLFFVDRVNRKQILVYNSIGSALPVITAANNINFIKIDLSGQHLYLTHTGQNYFSCYDISSKTKLWDSEDLCPEVSYNFIDDYTILDASGKVYKSQNIEEGFSYKFKTPLYSYRADALTTNNLYSYSLCSDYILTPTATGLIYVIDKSSWEILGQFNIGSTGAKLCSYNSTVIVGYVEDGVVKLSKLNLDEKQKVEYKEINLNEVSNVEFYPCTGIKTTELSPTDKKWSLNTESVPINAGNRGLPKATIKNNNTQTKYDRSTSGKIGMSGDGKYIEIVPPEDIILNDSSSYTVTIENLYNDDGLPCKAFYNIEIIYEPIPVPDPPSSDIYKIDTQSKTITGIEPSTSLSEFKSNIRYDGYQLIIKNHKGKIVTYGKIGTSFEVEFVLNNEIYMELTSIIYGDLTGTGNVNNTDIIALSNHLLGVKDLTGYFLIAADVNHDGQVNTIDLLGIKNYIRGTYEIVQYY